MLIIQQVNDYMTYAFILKKTIVQIVVILKFNYTYSKYIN